MGLGHEDPALGEVYWDTEHSPQGLVGEVVQGHETKRDRNPVKAVAYVVDKYHAVPSDHAHEGEERFATKTAAVQNCSGQGVSVQTHAVQPRLTVLVEVVSTWGGCGGCEDHAGGCCGCCCCWCC